MLLLAGRFETAEKPVLETEIQQSVPDTEKRLEEALRSVEGVGEVKVVIYYAGSESRTIARDKVEETDDAGKRYEEKVVFGRDSEPVVLRENSPEIRGVLIVAQGGGNTAVRARLISAAQALLGVEAHKIEVLKMKQQGG